MAIVRYGEATARTSNGFGVILRAHGVWYPYGMGRIQAMNTDGTGSL